MDGGIELLISADDWRSGSRLDVLVRQFLHLGIGHRPVVNIVHSNCASCPILPRMVGVAWLVLRFLAELFCESLLLGLLFLFLTILFVQVILQVHDIVSLLCV